MITTFKIYENSNNLTKEQLSTITKILNTKSNFMFCHRCGNQLHHGILICNKCGKKHNRNNGATIEQNLYILKNRMLNNIEPLITPSMIYDIYEKELKNDRINKNQFINYVESII